MELLLSVCAGRDNTTTFSRPGTQHGQMARGARLPWFTHNYILECPSRETGKTDRDIRQWVYCTAVYTARFEHTSVLIIETSLSLMLSYLSYSAALYCSARCLKELAASTSCPCPGSASSRPCTTVGITIDSYTNKSTGSMFRYITVLILASMVWFIACGEECVTGVLNITGNITDSSWRGVCVISP